MKLREIFANLKHECRKVEHYFPLYERHLIQFIGRAPRILEVGVQYGGSAEMWRKWFGPGTIIDGVDINPMCEETDYLKLYVGNQGSADFWKSAFGDRSNYYDIIIDDGSHDNPHQITTLIQTYGMLKDGGVFWCEDTHTSYYHEVRVCDGGYGNPNSFTSFSKHMIDVLNAHHTYNAIGVGNTPDGPHVPQILVNAFGRMQGIHFYDSVVVMEKGERLDFNEIIHVPTRPASNSKLLNSVEL